MCHNKGMKFISRNAAFPLFSIALLLGIFAVADLRFQNETVRGAGCTAHVSWDSGTVASGGSMRESWKVEGADFAMGECLPDSAMHGISNSGSFVFSNITHDISCTVVGFIGNTPACTSPAATIRVVGAAPSPPSTPTAGPKCYFLSPPGNAFQTISLPENYTGTVATNIRAGTGQTGEGTNTSGVIGEFTLEWGATNVVGFNNQPLGSGYSGVLSNNSSDSRFNISNENVGPSGTRAAKIGNTDITYSLQLRKDNQTVATCSVTAHHVVQVAPGPLAPTASDIFPGNGSYTLNAKYGNTTARFSYGKRVPQANFFLWEDRSFDTLLGNLGNWLFGTAQVAPGPAFRWDVSDPLNIKGPEVVELGYGSHDYSQGGGKGPIYELTWAHLDHYGGMSVAESPDGEARVEQHFGVGVEIGINWPSAGGTGFVGVIDGLGGGHGTRTSPSSRSSTKASTYTSAGRFFSYGPTTGNQVGVFDLTDIEAVSQGTRPGTPGPRYSGTELKRSGTIPWGGVTELLTLDIPGKGQFLIGRSAGGTPTAPTAIIRIAKLNPETGKTSTPTPKSHTLGSAARNIQPAVYNGKGYLFVVESVSGAPFVAPNIMVIGVYEMNPTDLSLKKIHTLRVEDGDWYSQNTYGIASSPVGDVQPLLILSAKFNLSDLWDNSSELRVYGLKKVFSESASTLTAGNADFVLTKVGPSSYAKEGDVVVNQVPFNAVLKSQGGKTNLHFFRHAHILLGSYSSFDNPFGVYGEVTSLSHPIFGNAYPTQRMEPGLTGAASIRADVIDVTALTGAGSGSSGGGPPPPPGGGGNPPVGSGGNCYARYPNNVQLRNLCEQIEALKQQLCALNSSLSACASSQ